MVGSALAAKKKGEKSLGVDSNTRRATGKKSLKRRHERYLDEEDVKKREIRAKITKSTNEKRWGVRKEHIDWCIVTKTMDSDEGGG